MLNNVLVAVTLNDFNFLFVVQVLQCHPFCGTEGCWGIMPAATAVLQKQRRWDNKPS